MWMSLIRHFYSRMHRMLSHGVGLVLAGHTIVLMVFCLQAFLQMPDTVLPWSATKLYHMS